MYRLESSGRLFKEHDLGGSMYRWLPWDYLAGFSIDFIKDTEDEDCKLLYSDAAIPAHYQIANATKSGADAPLVLATGSGTSYAATALPLAAAPTRLLVVVPYSFPDSGDTATAYVSGDQNLLPRILFSETIASVSAINSSLDSGVNNPIAGRPIYMFTNQTASGAKTIVFCADTPLGKESVISRAFLENHAGRYFGVTGFANTSTIQIREIYALELT
jgi:hypothetical protein